MDEEEKTSRSGADDNDEDTTTDADKFEHENDADETSSESDNEERVDEESDNAENGKNSSLLQPLSKGSKTGSTSNSVVPESSKVNSVRIKLKMPNIGASGLPSHRRSLPSNSEPSEAKKRGLPMANKATSRILPTAGSRKPNAPSQSQPIRVPSSAVPSGAENKLKSRIRSLKLPLTKPPDAVVAEVLDSDEDDEVDAEGVPAVATVVSSSATSATASAISTAKVLAGKRRSSHPTRIRFPPLLSPGLLVASSQSNKQQNPDSWSTASEIFDQAMIAAGYSLESRTQRPHRGSSTTRTVGDMFDSDIKLCLHFPPLVPPELWNFPPTPDEQHADAKMETEQMNGSSNHIDQGQTALPERLIQGLKNAKKRCCPSRLEANVTGKRSSKRHRLWDYREMIPVSLTIPYPDTFVDDRLDYVRRVLDREAAIIRKQEIEEDAEARGDSTGDDFTKIEIPPIPQLPKPPVMNDPTFAEQYTNLQHPYFLPKAHPEFVAHLDKNCFHITEGRYCGLTSNFIADPNFVGANAPGIQGVNSVGGSGLATATAGGGFTGALTLTSSFLNAALSATTDLVPSSALPATSESPVTISEVTPGSKQAVKPDSSLSDPAADGEKLQKKKVLGKESKTVKQKKSLSPTASTASLRKVMDEGGKAAGAMRDHIIRAAVYASRTGHHGEPFSAADKVYPDVSKAFAAHAGIKPCQRCKNNKQGAYHCRLRRRHFEPDFDGGDSAKDIKLLFDVNIEELLPEDESA